VLLEAPPFGIPLDYRQKIVAWTKRYFVEPNSVRILAVSDPMPVLVTFGRKIVDLKNEDCEHPQIARREWGRWPVAAARRR